MLFRGACKKCGAVGRRTQEWDAGARGRRFYCIVCGFTHAWLKRDGSIYEPPPWVPEWMLNEYRPSDADAERATNRTRDLDTLAGSAGLRQ